MRVKPAIPGNIVRDPSSKRLLPPEGDEVPESSYWMRRLRSGDVVLVDSTAAPVARPEFAPVPPLATRSGKE